MPHVAIEYTGNLADSLDVNSLVDTLHSAAQKLGVFPHWGIRTYASAIDRYRIADDIAGGDTGYVHVRVKIAGGKDAPTVQRIVDELHSALGRELEEVSSHRPVGFQLEVFEFDPTTTRSGGSIPGSPTAANNAQQSAPSNERR
ncbi:hypothetical protein GCM10007304_45360 [Rhodococcoides trifolii]|uniref:5-carboxymethyl-2-hydroxymuconate Delta-isomerase n=1 Tax=Rhodococcoides trifolii TaxID=908250 RepID=A0A917LIC1_9NOCA|nr:hypothetical protein [Rhodococcus trifolii]GGG26463.1 hypothetical protein GCM10007304_45360 [Rhodococcus trifolii]